MRSRRGVIPVVGGIILCAGVLMTSVRAAEGPPPPSPPPQRITALQAAVLGFIQGMTEYLPVSSTGHLILTNHALGLSRFSGESGPLGPKIVIDDSVEAFDIVLHLGTVLAVLGLYRKRVVQMARGLMGRDPDGMRLLAALGIAFLPAAFVGLAFNKPIKETFYNPVSVAAALAIGGVLMIVIERYFWTRRKNIPRVTQVDHVRLWQAFVIGCAQCIALMPGTSRSMITILAALVIGLDMVTAAEFSFLVALPTLGAATVYEGYKHWSVMTESVGMDGMIIGLLVTTVVAALAIKGLVKWLSGHGLAPFGYYRIALAAAVLAYFAW